MTQPAPVEVTTTVTMSPRKISVRPQRTGVPGPAGAPGTPGASAYVLAVQSGFVGSLTDYLASLHAAGSQGSQASNALQAHVDSTTPHPVYDDGPSLALYYQNQKV